MKRDEQDDSGTIQRLNESVRRVDGRITIPAAVFMAFLAFYGPADRLGGDLAELKTYAKAQQEQMASLSEKIARLEGSAGAAIQQSAEALERVASVDERLRSLEQTVAQRTGTVDGRLDLLSSELNAVGVVARRADDRARQSMRDDRQSLNK